MPHPSVVLDTNVLVSAHLKEDGLEALVLDLALNRKLKLFVSAAIVEEYRIVLARPRLRISAERAVASLQLIEKVATQVLPKKIATGAKDPADNKFLECAEEAQADYLVTGNNKHFPQRWGPTRILNSRQFLPEIGADLQR